MKHLIYNCPNPTYLLSNFIREGESLNNLNDYVKVDFSGYELVGIESEKGNGGSHLLNAIANELRNRGVRIAFLHFNADVHFSELTDFHLQEILRSQMIFIDHLHMICSDQVENKRLLDFLISIRKNSRHLFYSCPSENSEVNRLILESGFLKPNLIFKLNALGIEQRIEWSKELMIQNQLDKVTKEFYSSAKSNGDFLNQIQDLLSEYRKNQKKANISLKNELEILICQTEIKLLKIKLGIARLNEKKIKSIQENQYEKAAEINMLQRELKSKSTIVELEVIQLKDKLM